MECREESDVEAAGAAAGVMPIVLTIASVGEAIGDGDQLVDCRGADRAPRGDQPRDLDDGERVPRSCVRAPIRTRTRTQTTSDPDSKVTDKVA